MRIAVFSDIHGNPIALRAVLADIEQRGGADAYWLLGDYCAIGYDPVTVLELLSQLPSARFIRGNTDRFLVTDDAPAPTEDEVRDNLELLELFAVVKASFAWTQGYLAATQWTQWLAGLPFSMRATLPDGTRVLGVHAALDNDETVIHPHMTDDEMTQAIGPCDADLYLFGHIHYAFERRVGPLHVVNVGSVSNPPQDDLRASYIFLDADETGYSIHFQHVGYDHQAVIEAGKRVRFPDEPYVSHFMRGEHKPGWKRH